MTEPTAPSGRPAKRSRRWLVVVTLVWVAVLAASAVYAWRKPAPTDREQTTVAQARPVVDEAVARLATAASVDGQAVVAVSDFEHVGSCDVSVFRRGERYRRALTAMVQPGTESGLLTRVAARLPAAYGALVRTGEAPRLTADAGFWVLVTATVTAPGEVTFFADTGDCRPAGDGLAADPLAPVPADAVPDVLDRLHLGGGDRRTAAVSCQDGGIAGTVRVRAGAYSAPLDAALANVNGATVVVATPRLYAYRLGTTQVAVRIHGQDTIVTATAPCQSQ